MNRERPEDVGFVFWRKSRRCVSRETAAGLRRQLDPQIRSIGVFVDAAPEEIMELVEQHIITVVQLHGHEEADYLAELRKRIPGTEIWKACLIHSRDDLMAAQQSSADMLLLDSGLGGGRRFDWSLLQDIHRPYYLAGGLDPENVVDAVRTLRPYGVDVSSGVEQDGIKDGEKVRRFIRAVRENDGMRKTEKKSGGEKA